MRYNHLSASYVAASFSTGHSQPYFAVSFSNRSKFAASDKRTLAEPLKLKLTEVIGITEPNAFSGNEAVFCIRTQLANKRRP